MGFLDMFRGKAAAEVSVPQRLRSATKPTQAGARKVPLSPPSASATSSPEVGGKVVMLPTAKAPAEQVEVSEPVPGQSGSLVAKTIKDLGSFTVESAQGGAYQVSDSVRKSMAVLYHPMDKEYSVIATPDAYASAAYMSLVRLVTDKSGATVRPRKVDTALLDRIYGGAVVVEDGAEKNAELIQAMKAVVAQALAEQASDIHIEKRGQECRVNYRIFNDIVVDKHSWTSEYAERMARALHWMADEDSKDTTWSSDAVMAVSMTLPDGERVKLRIQCADAYPDGGLDIVIRILRVGATAKIRSFEELGYEGEQLEEIEQMFANPAGMIVLSGITGSGKSTTMQTGMHELGKGGGKKMLSIEDPPEYVMPGVTQMPVPRRKQDKEKNINPFPEKLKAALRMDPDVLMIGEIRDEATAQLASEAVITGHKVLTSIHALSGVDIITRLQLMNVSNVIMGGRGFISGFIHQSLVPILCKECKVPFNPNRDQGLSKGLLERLRAVTSESDGIYLRGPGCRHCADRGVSGRTVCAEVLMFNDTMRKAIIDGNISHLHDLIKRQRQGVIRVDPNSLKFASVRDHAIMKMKRGECSPVDVEAAVQTLYDPNEDMAFEAMLG